MPVNRFDQPIGQRYVSQYVPLPFQELAALGENIQKRSQTADDQMSALEKMIADVNVANEVLSEGSGDDIGLKFRSTGYLDYKNELLNKVKTGHAELYDKYKNNEIDLREFEKRARDFNNQFKQDFSKLKLAEANSKVIEDMNKKIREHKQASSNPFLLNQLGEQGTDFLKDPFIKEYHGASIDDALDLEKIKNEYAKDFKSQIISSGAGTDKNGYIIYTDKSGVTRDRIINSVNSTFDSDPFIGKQTREQTNRWLRDNGLNWNSEIKLNNGSVVKAGDYYYGNLKQDFIEGVVAKAEQSDIKKQIKKDYLFERALDKADEEKKINDALVGAPIESRTFNVSLFEQDPKAKSLIDDGIIKNNNGIIQIDKDKLVQDLKTYDKVNFGSGTIMGTNISSSKGNVKSYEKITELTDFVLKIGKELGYNPKDIRYDNFEKIINHYNAGSMMRIADEQMPDVVREIETTKLKNNWNNYDFFDTDNPNVPLEDKPTIEKGDEVILNNFRNILKKDGGEMYRDGYIKKANGEIIPIMTKPASLIDDKYHDNISHINLAYTKADLNQIRPKNIKTEDGSLIIQNDIPVSNKGYVDVLKVSSTKVPEDIKNQYPDRSQFTVIKYKPKDGSQPITFYNQMDYQQFMLQQYYKTRLGSSETKIIAPKKQRYESIDNNEDND